MALFVRATLAALLLAVSWVPFSFAQNSTNGVSTCVDSDGDGYGWNGVETCDPATGSTTTGTNSASDTGASSGTSGSADTGGSAGNKTLTETASAGTVLPLAWLIQLPALRYLLHHLLSQTTSASTLTETATVGTPPPYRAAWYKTAHH